MARISRCCCRCNSHLPFLLQRRCFAIRHFSKLFMVDSFFANFLQKNKEEEEKEKRLRLLLLLRCWGTAVAEVAAVFKMFVWNSALKGSVWVALSLSLSLSLSLPHTHTLSLYSSHSSYLSHSLSLFSWSGFLRGFCSTLLRLNKNIFSPDLSPEFIFILQVRWPALNVLYL